MDELSAEIATLKERMEFLEREMSEHRSVVEQSFNQRLDTITAAIETLSEDVKSWSAQVGTNHLHMCNVTGDLANRVHVLENPE